MGERRAAFQVVVGPNEGDVLHVERGHCRLIGRHLSENETVLMDPDGNRELDQTATDMLHQRFKERERGKPVAAAAPARRAVPVASPGSMAAASPSAPATPYTRGPDIILTDGAISRAHAMLFADATGPGIIDLASTNGTYVNNSRVSSRMLADGDVIAIGSSEIAASWRGK